MTEKNGGDGEDEPPGLHVVGPNEKPGKPKKLTQKQLRERAAASRGPTYDFRVAGLNYRQIAAQFGVAVSTAHGYYKAGLAAEMKMKERAADEHREVIMERIRVGLRGVWPSYVRGDAAAVLSIYRLTRLIIDMFGLKQPMKIDVSVELREVADRMGLDYEAAVDEASRVILTAADGKR